MKIIEKSIEVELSKIDNWKENPRSIKPQDFERLKKQLKEIGKYKPLLCERQGKKFITLGGNMRLKAMRENGDKKAWITIIEPRNQKERVEISLSDNDRAGFYVADDLLEQIKGLDINLEDFKVDMTAPITDLQSLLDQNIKSEEGDDDIPEKRKTKIKIGDMFQLGSHRLLCGDCTVEENVKKLMGGKKADMVLTDPPYGIGFKYNKHKDEKGAVYEKFCDKWFNCISDIDNKIIFTGWTYNKFWFAKEPYDVFYWIVKNKHSGGKNSYFRNTEPILMWGRFHKQFNFDFILDNGIERLKGPESIHTCPKPVKMFCDFIAHSTKPNNIVLDIFLGSGTTIIACEKTKRICYGMELDETYCQVILDRWENQTGLKAVKV